MSSVCLTGLPLFHSSFYFPFLLLPSFNLLLMSPMQHVICTMLGNQRSEKKSPPWKSSGSHEKIDLCVVMHRMSQSYLVKGQTITIRSEWEEKMMPWSPIQLGMWIHTFYSEKKSKILKVRRTCLMYSHFRGELFYFETILLPPASSYIPFKMCL